MGESAGLPEVLIIGGAVRQGHVKVAGLLARWKVPFSMHAHREHARLIPEDQRSPIALRHQDSQDDGSAVGAVMPPLLPSRNQAHSRRNEGNLWV